MLCEFSDKVAKPEGSGKHPKMCDFEWDYSAEFACADSHVLKDDVSVEDENYDDPYYGLKLVADTGSCWDLSELQRAEEYHEAEAMVPDGVQQVLKRSCSWQCVWVPEEDDEPSPKERQRAARCEKVRRRTLYRNLPKKPKPKTKPQTQNPPPESSTPENPPPPEPSVSEPESPPLTAEQMVDEAIAVRNFHPPKEIKLTKNQKRLLFAQPKYSRPMREIAAEHLRNAETKTDSESWNAELKDNMPLVYSLLAMAEHELGGRLTVLQTKLRRGVLVQWDFGIPKRRFYLRKYQCYTNMVLWALENVQIRPEGTLGQLSTLIKNAMPSDVMCTAELSFDIALAFFNSVLCFVNAAYANKGLKIANLMLAVPNVLQLAWKIFKLVKFELSKKAKETLEKTVTEGFQHIGDILSGKDPGAKATCIRKDLGISKEEFVEAETEANALAEEATEELELDKDEFPDPKHLYPQPARPAINEKQLLQALSIIMQANVDLPPAYTELEKATEPRKPRPHSNKRPIYITPQSEDTPPSEEESKGFFADLMTFMKEEGPENPLNKGDAKKLLAQIATKGIFWILNLGCVAVFRGFFGKDATRDALTTLQFVQCGNNIANGITKDFVEGGVSLFKALNHTDLVANELLNSKLKIASSFLSQPDNELAYDHQRFCDMVEFKNELRVFLTSFKGGAEDKSVIMLLNQYMIRLDEKFRSCYMLSAQKPVRPCPVGVYLFSNESGVGKTYMVNKKLLKDLCPYLGIQREQVSYVVLNQTNKYFTPVPKDCKITVVDELFFEGFLDVWAKLANNWLSTMPCSRQGADLDGKNSFVNDRYTIVMSNKPGQELGANDTSPQCQEAFYKRFLQFELRHPDMDAALEDGRARTSKEGIVNDPECERYYFHRYYYRGARRLPNGLRDPKGGEVVEYVRNTDGTKRVYTYSEVLEILKAQHRQNMDDYVAQLVQLKQGSVMQQAMLQKTKVAKAGAIDPKSVLISVDDFVDPASKTLANMYPIPLLLWASENLGKEPSSTEMERINSGMSQIGSLLKTHLKAPVIADESYFRLLGACYQAKRNAIIHITPDAATTFGLGLEYFDLKYQFFDHNGTPFQDQVEWVYDNGKWNIASKIVIAAENHVESTPFVAMIHGPTNTGKTVDSKDVGKRLAKLLNYEYAEVNLLDLTQSYFLEGLRDNLRKPLVLVTSDLVQSPHYQSFYDYLRADDILINTANDGDLAIRNVYLPEHLWYGRWPRVIATEIPRYISMIPGMKSLPFGIGKNLKIKSNWVPIRSIATSRNGVEFGQGHVRRTGLVGDLQDQTGARVRQRDVDRFEAFYGDEKTCGLRMVIHPNGFHKRISTADDLLDEIWEVLSQKFAKTGEIVVQEVKSHEFERILRKTPEQIYVKAKDYQDLRTMLSSTANLHAAVRSYSKDGYGVMATQEIMEDRNLCFTDGATFLCDLPVKYDLNTLINVGKKMYCQLDGRKSDIAVRLTVGDVDIHIFRRLASTTSTLPDSKMSVVVEGQKVFVSTTEDLPVTKYTYELPDVISYLMGGRSSAILQGPRWAAGALIQEKDKLLRKPEALPTITNYHVMMRRQKAIAWSQQSFKDQMTSIVGSGGMQVLKVLGVVMGILASIGTIIGAIVWIAKMETPAEAEARKKAEEKPAVYALVENRVVTEAGNRDSGASASQDLAKKEHEKQTRRILGNLALVRQMPVTESCCGMDPVYTKEEGLEWLYSKIRTNTVQIVVNGKHQGYGLAIGPTEILFPPHFVQHKSDEMEIECMVNGSKVTTPVTKRVLSRYTEIGLAYITANVLPTFKNLEKYFKTEENIDQLRSVVFYQHNKDGWDKVIADARLNVNGIHANFGGNYIKNYVSVMFGDINYRTLPGMCGLTYLDHAGEGHQIISGIHIGSSPGVAYFAVVTQELLQAIRGHIDPQSTMSLRCENTTDRVEPMVVEEGNGEFAEQLEKIPKFWDINKELHIHPIYGEKLLLGTDEIFLPKEIPLDNPYLYFLMNIPKMNVPPPEKYASVWLGKEFIERAEELGLTPIKKQCYTQYHPDMPSEFYLDTFDKDGNPKGKSLAYAQLAKILDPGTGLSRKSPAMQFAARRLHDVYENAPAAKEFRTLNDDEVVNGVTHGPYKGCLGGLNMDSTVGIMWRQHGSKLRDFFTLEGKEESLRWCWKHDSKTLEFKEAYNQAIALATTGARFMTVAQIALKNEENLTGKPRVYDSIDSIDKLLCKKFYGTFLAFSVYIHEFSHDKVGIDPANGLCKVINRMRSLPGCKYLDLDVSRWDKHMFAETMTTAFVTIRDFMIDHWKDRRFDRSAFWSASDVILAGLITPFRMVNGNLFVSTRSLCSGSVFTTVLNGAMNYLIVNAILYTYCERNGILSELYRYIDQTSFAFLGDDSLLAFSGDFLENIPITAPEWIELYKELFGLTVTSPEKDALPRYKTFGPGSSDEICFMSRTFQYVPNNPKLVIAALKVESIVTLLLKTSRKNGIRTILENWTTALMEAARVGEAFYSKVLSFRKDLIRSFVASDRSWTDKQTIQQIPKLPYQEMRKIVEELVMKNGLVANRKPAYSCGDLYREDIPELLEVEKAPSQRQAAASVYPQPTNAKQRRTFARRSKNKLQSFEHVQTLKTTDKTTMGSLPFWMDPRPRPGVTARNAPFYFNALYNVPRTQARGIPCFGIATRLTPGKFFWVERGIRGVFKADTPPTPLGIGIIDILSEIGQQFINNMQPDQVFPFLDRMARELRGLDVAAVALQDGLMVINTELESYTFEAAAPPVQLPKWTACRANFCGHSAAGITFNFLLEYWQSKTDLNGLVVAATAENIRGGHWTSLPNGLWEKDGQKYALSDSLQQVIYNSFTDLRLYAHGDFEYFAHLFGCQLDVSREQVKLRLVAPDAGVPGMALLAPHRTVMDKAKDFQQNYNAASQRTQRQMQRDIGRLQYIPNTQLEACVEELSENINTINAAEFRALYHYISLEQLKSHAVVREIKKALDSVPLPNPTDIDIDTDSEEEGMADEIKRSLKSIPTPDPDSDDEVTGRPPSPRKLGTPSRLRMESAMASLPDPAQAMPDVGAGPAEVIATASSVPATLIGGTDLSSGMFRAATTANLLNVSHEVWNQLTAYDVTITTETLAGTVLMKLKGAPSFLASAAQLFVLLHSLYWLTLDFRITCYGNPMMTAAIRIYLCPHDVNLTGSDLAEYYQRHKYIELAVNTVSSTEITLGPSVGQDMAANLWQDQTSFVLDTKKDGFQPGQVAYVVLHKAMVQGFDNPGNYAEIKVESKLSPLSQINYLNMKAVKSALLALQSKSTPISFLSSPRITLESFRGKTLLEAVHIALDDGYVKQEEHDIGIFTNFTGYSTNVLLPIPDANLLGGRLSRIDQVIGDPPLITGQTSSILWYTIGNDLREYRTSVDYATFGIYCVNNSKKQALFANGVVWDFGARSVLEAHLRDNYHKIDGIEHPPEYNHCILAVSTIDDEWGELATNTHKNYDYTNIQEILNGRGAIRNRTATISIFYRKDYPRQTFKVKFVEVVANFAEPDYSIWEKPSTAKPSFYGNHKVVSHFYLPQKDSFGKPNITEDVSMWTLLFEPPTEAWIATNSSTRDPGTSLPAEHRLIGIDLVPNIPLVMTNQSRIWDSNMLSMLRRVFIELDTDVMLELVNTDTETPVCTLRWWKSVKQFTIRMVDSNCPGSVEWVNCARCEVPGSKLKIHNITPTNSSAATPVSSNSNWSSRWVDIDGTISQCKREPDAQTLTDRVLQQFFKRLGVTAPIRPESAAGLVQAYIPSNPFSPLSIHNHGGFRPFNTGPRRTNTADVPPPYTPPHTDNSVVTGSSDGSSASEWEVISTPRNSVAAAPGPQPTGSDHTYESIYNVPSEGPSTAQHTAQTDQYDTAPSTYGSGDDNATEKRRIVNHIWEARNPNVAREASFWEDGPHANPTDNRIEPPKSITDVTSTETNRPSTSNSTGTSREGPSSSYKDAHEELSSNSSVQGLANLDSLPTMSKEEILQHYWDGIGKTSGTISANNGKWTPNTFIRNGVRLQSSTPTPGIARGRSFGARRPIRPESALAAAAIQEGGNMMSGMMNAHHDNRARKKQHQYNLEYLTMGGKYLKARDERNQNFQMQMLDKRYGIASQTTKNSWEF
ncbi:MAG: polyprotein [Sanya gryllotalpa orientalis Solinvi-like virus 1]|nr:MAG: polyprotein [Sanya gryllotalpa orientalis Solinvi-like virus 1]